MSARRRLFLLPLLCAALLLPATARAHAHLVRADLAPDSHLRVPAGTVRFWFDEALNPALTRILIRDARGRQVNADTGRVDPANAEEVDLHVPALADGQYTVFWTSDSAQDGHILHGFYLFAVGGPGAAPISASPAAIIGTDTPQLDSTALASALAHWLVLVASTLWTGALALEILVLAPARVRAGSRPAALSRRASGYLGTLARAGLFATLATSVLELEVQAYAADGWSGLVSSTTLSAILQSHYGTYWIVRVFCAFLALLLLGMSVGAWSRAVPASGAGQRSDLSAQPDEDPPALPWHPLLAPIVGVLGLAYLLALALSGHAAAVSQLVFTSVVLDWLHLLANAVWIGGMAAIALALVPAVQAQLTEKGVDRAAGGAAFLTLLDRYSPAAVLAVITAMVTGMFNAQVHLGSLDQLVETAYGRFLLIKLALIAEILVLSASHVFLTRPRLRAMTADGSIKNAGEAYASLIMRLRVEPAIGALILLCVALMGQVAPAVTVFSNAATTSQTSGQDATATPVPAASSPISATVSRGLLTVTLTISNPAGVGRTRLFATVRERGRVVTDGQVRFKLSVPDTPALGAVFVETTPSAGGYGGSGDLVQAGRWRADVLVRTHSDPGEFRDVPFDFVAGQQATFLEVPAASTRYGPATVVSLVQPSDAPGTLTVRLRPGLQVRYLISMPVMPGMGSADYDARPGADGTYSGQVIFPMLGITDVAIQVMEGGTWHLARLLVYNVDSNGTAHLLTASQAPATRQASAAPAAFNVSFALHLPYAALVTRMRNNTVSRLDGTGVHTGQMPHGVDFVDGTNLAYVTDFLQGDVVILDLRTLHILHRIPVGLEPAHVVFSPDHRLAFASNFLTNDVSVIDMHTARVVGDITVGLRPHGLDLSPDGRTLYVACEGAAAIYAISTRTLKVTGEAVAGLEPLGVTVNPANGEINVTDARGNLVHILEPGSLRQRAAVPVGKGPALMAISADGSRLYVANQLGNTVSVIDTRGARVLATIPVGSGPHGPDLTPDGKYLYVPSINAGTITILRTADNRVVAVVPIGQGPNEVAILH